MFFDQFEFPKKPQKRLQASYAEDERWIRQSISHNIGFDTLDLLIRERFQRMVLEMLDIEMQRQRRAPAKIAPELSDTPPFATEAVEDATAAGPSPSPTLSLEEQLARHCHPSLDRGGQGGHESYNLGTPE